MKHLHPHHLLALEFQPMMYACALVKSILDTSSRDCNEMRASFDFCLLLFGRLSFYRYFFSSKTFISIWQRHVTADIIMKSTQRITLLWSLVNALNIASNWFRRHHVKRIYDELFCDLELSKTCNWFMFIFWSPVLFYFPKKRKYFI